MIIIDRVNAPASGNDNQQGFHYVLSKAQEDEIREAFLLDKIKNYTQVRKIAMYVLFETKSSSLSS